MAAESQVMADLFFKDIFKTEKPFGNPATSYTKFKYGQKSRTFNLRGIPYKILSEKNAEYKSNDRVE